MFVCSICLFWLEIKDKISPLIVCADPKFIKRKPLQAQLWEGWWTNMVVVQFVWRAGSLFVFVHFWILYLYNFEFCICILLHFVFVHFWILNLYTFKFCICIFFYFDNFKFQRDHLHCIQPLHIQYQCSNPYGEPVI